MKPYSKKIPIVALLIESSRASGRALLDGIAQFAQHYGHWSFYWEPGGLEKAWPKLKALNVDGIILRDVDKLDEVKRLDIPAVVIGHSKREIPNFVNVVTDSTAIGKIGAEHLLTRGFKHFAYCGYGSISPSGGKPKLLVWSELRRASFQKGIEKAGFKVDTHCVLSAATSAWTDELSRMTHWLRSLPKPVGLMACNDDCGRQVIEACKLAELTVPDEVGVLGADNDELVCGLSAPPMSSVAINFERAGYEAALVLNDLLRGKTKAPVNITVATTHVVVRSSTDFVAITDRNLSKALQFMRDHLRENIMVSDIARFAGLSRRSLEIKFRQEMKFSIHKYIRRMRTDQIVRLLMETELPVGDIAESLGFSDVQHFARYFRAGKGISPLAFRRAYGKR
ncbi:MAG TPA: DNA-binding transcriptional regulator [Candidatus Acidoferrales bacterium]|nr:DNA-binding transcriptional regulator [Candidatus Acidoferrales bacterium]